MRVIGDHDRMIVDAAKANTRVVRMDKRQECFLIPFRLLLSVLAVACEARCPEQGHVQRGTRPRLALRPLPSFHSHSSDSHKRCDQARLPSSATAPHLPHLLCRTSSLSLSLSLSLSPYPPPPPLLTGGNSLAGRISSRHAHICEFGRFQEGRAKEGTGHNKDRGSSSVKGTSHNYLLSVNAREWQ